MLQVRLVQLQLWTLKMSYWWKLTFQISWGLLLHFTGAVGKFIMVLVKFLHDCMYQKLFKLVYFYWVIQKLKSHFHSYFTIKFFTRFRWHCRDVWYLQMVQASMTMSSYPSSKIAHENVDVFANAWSVQINDLSVLVKDVNDSCHGKSADRQVYLSLPRPGVSQLSFGLAACIWDLHG